MRFTAVECNLLLCDAGSLRYLKMAALSIDRAISRLVVLGIRLFLSYLNLKLFFHADIADIECQNIQRARTYLNFVSKKKHKIF